MISVFVNEEIFLDMVRSELENYIEDDVMVIELYMQMYKRISTELLNYCSGSINVKGLVQDDLAETFIIYDDDETHKYNEVKFLFDKYGFDEYVEDDLCDYIEANANGMFLLRRVK